MHGYTEMSRVFGKVCVVCGGSRGIGKSVCETLAGRGGKVVVLGRNGETATDTAKSLTLLSSSSHASFNHVGIACDVSKEEEVKKCFREIQSRVGDIDVLINAAGINKDSLLLRTKLSDVQSQVGTNLLGPIFTTQAVLKSMMQRREGCIINIGSVVGLKGNSGQTVYSSTKAGLVGFTKSLAKEVASRNIRVNLVAPGYITTEMTATLKDIPQLTSAIPLGKMGKPQEVAQAVCFIAESLYITGQVLVVDGGLQLTI